MADNHQHHNVKLEPFHHENPQSSTENQIREASNPAVAAAAFIELSSSNSDDSGGNKSDDLNDIINSILRDKGTEPVSLDFGDVNGGGTSTMFQLPLGFLDPFPPPLPPPTPPVLPPQLILQEKSAANVNLNGREYKQFWKAGDYEGSSCGVWDANSAGMEHVRVHPKFLHSNATSHKWALGAFAELLDNALDEICSGATYANIEMLQNNKDGNRMLLIEDNGGGMDPDKMRHCMSLGYSAKSKIANTIGQYGNGFKTSTMRLGADVIVFSRSGGNSGKCPTQSIGLLSYTFLRSTGKEDIVVPMLDYERGEGEWKNIIRSTPDDWNTNVETIVQWSPFSDEAELLGQFNLVKEHGTRIYIYNLWEDDQGLLELDFDTDKYDILLRGANRDEKNIQMANQYPNSRHFLTYKHSLRSYASILYLKLPAGFRFIIRGKDVEHHNIVNDMMVIQEVTYRPQPGSDGIHKNLNMVATVTIGFVKDAVHHIDVQGFNVYHKNRLIKPFWRLWKASGTDGRGVIGVLEANFVEPAHDKQGFERTNVLARLEARLIQMQKTYWYHNCHKIGYAPKHNKYSNVSSQDLGMFNTSKSLDGNNDKGQETSILDNGWKTHPNSGKRASLSEPSSSSDDNNVGEKGLKRCNQKKETLKNCYEKRSTTTISSSLSSEIRDTPKEFRPNEMLVQPYKISQSKGGDSDGSELFASNFNSDTVDQLRKENCELMERLRKKDEDVLKDLMLDVHHTREKRKLLEIQLQEAQQIIDDKSRNQEDLIRVISEERGRRGIEEENLRKELKAATNTIQELLRQMKSSNSRSGF